MGTEQLEYAYAGQITKSDKLGDGSLMVYGVATDPSTDLDGQACDPAWLKSAMPDWFASAANVREQHGPVAAGVGKELTEGDNGAWLLKAHIVDPSTVRKVEAGVLKGFSIGVRQGKVLRGKSASAPNGVIVGGKIVEVSLVDRPCNPRATMTICKALGAENDDMTFVEPLLIDIDPAVYGEQDVSSVDDVDGEPDDEQDSQAVDEPVDGDDDADGGDELTLFGDLLDDDEDDESDDVDAEVVKAMGLAARDGEVTITKGLLEQLIHGPKDPKRGKGGRFAGSNKKPDTDAAAARKRREAEAKRERKHRGAIDAEALQDANNAQRQGRRQEADEHRGRLGSYRKALSVREYREGVRLVADVLDGKIVKGAHNLAGDAETIAELADFAAVEADQLAGGGYIIPEDVSVLLDTCAAIAKMAGIEPAFLQPEGSAVDESTAAATLDVAEIVKAQVAEQLSEIQKAHEVEIANLHARVTKMAATPLPGGPVINKSVMPSAPAVSSTSAKAAYYAEQAANPTLAPNIKAAYAAAAELERAKG